MTANGEYGVPRQRINRSADRRYGPWAVVWKACLIGRMYERCPASPSAALSPPPWIWCSNNAGDTNELGTTVYNDIETSHTKEDWNTTFTLGVNNFLDRSPPVSMTACAGNFLSVYYRIPGCWMYLRAVVDF